MTSKWTDATEVNWSPMATNPLDFVTGWYEAEHKLISYSGEVVIISRSGNDFVVTIGDRREITGGNTNTCYFLNVNQVRIRR